jgi:uncharacterized protein YjbJ (UPF0337 family)
MTADSSLPAQAGAPETGAPETGVAETAKPDRQAILDDIDRTREQMGQTVEALAAKADVKGRAQQKAGEVSGRVQQQARGAAATTAQHWPEIAAAAAAAAAVVAGWLVIRRMRR